MVTTTDGWEGLLDKDERILWQGQPDGRFILRAEDIKAAAMGIFFTAFALVWIVLASQSGGYFWMIGLIHLTIGLGITARALFKDWWLRRHSHYSLSNKRAFIATDAPYMGRKLRSWPITSQTELTLIEGRTDTLLFGREMSSGMHGQIRSTAVGFEQIHGGRKVHSLMRAIQRGHEE